MVLRGPAWVKACAVFGLYLLYWLCYNHVTHVRATLVIAKFLLADVVFPQISNNLVSQPATMTLNGVPNEVSRRESA